MSYNNDEGSTNPRGEVIMTWNPSTGEVEAVSSANPLPVSGGGGGSSTQVEGMAADNAASTGNPVLTGGKFFSSAQTYANGDVAVSQADINGYRKVTQAGNTPAVTQVASSATSVTLKAANAARRSLIIHNDSSSILKVKYGTSASATSYTFPLAAGDTAFINDYTGNVDGIWDTASGNAYVTEVV